MTIDLKALAAKLTEARQTETRIRGDWVLKTDDLQRDKFWRTLGKKVRSDVKHTTTR